MLDMKSIGQRYTQVRKSLNLTQEELAEKVTGESNNYVISRLEAGKITNIEALANYADALGTPLEYFICGINFSNKDIVQQQQKSSTRLESGIITTKSRRDKNNWIFGETTSGKTILKNDSDPSNFLIIGKNKNDIIKPNIFRSIERGENILVSEPNFELAKDITSFANRSGYKTHIINLNDSESETWDVMSYIQDKDGRIIEEKLNQLISAIVANSRFHSEESKFYSFAEEHLIRALVFWLKVKSLENPTKYDFTMNSLAELAYSFNEEEYLKDIDNTTRELLRKTTDKNFLRVASKASYGAFISASKETKDSIRMSVFTDIKLYQNNVFSYIDIDEFFTSFYDDEKFLICIIPNKDIDTDTSPVYIYQLLQEILIERTPDNEDRRGLSVYINELHSKELSILELNKIISFSKKANCSFVISLSSIYQLKHHLMENVNALQQLFANSQYCMIVSSMERDTDAFLLKNSPQYISHRLDINTPAKEDEVLLLTSKSVSSFLTPSKH